MFTQPSIDCQSDTYRAYLAIVIVFLILFIIGLPISVVGVGWYQRRNNSHSSFSSSTSAFSLFSEMFQTRAWAWQAIILIRRCAFVVITAQLVSTPVTRAFAYAILNFGFLLIQLNINPFNSPLLNHAETSLHCVLVLISLILTAYPIPYDIQVAFALFFLIVIPTAILGVIHVHSFWKMIQTNKINRSRKSTQLNDANTQDVYQVELQTIQPNTTSPSSSSSSSSLSSIVPTTSSHPASNTALQCASSLACLLPTPSTTTHTQQHQLYNNMIDTESIQSDKQQL